MAVGPDFTLQTMMMSGDDDDAVQWLAREGESASGKDRKTGMSDPRSIDFD